jgi:FkbM family methyltransferase
MKKVNGGAWIPDDEEDRVMLGAGVKYQSNKLLAALPYCKRARTAIDAGAHCGLWTVQLAQYFERVEAFEPLQRHIECWKKNASWKLTNHLHEVALGEKDSSCGMHLVERMSARSHVNGGSEYKMNRLDDYEFENVDFIKVDVEGYELFVLKGAEQTLLKYKPCVVVEQKPHHGGKYGLSDTAAVDYLKSLGAEVRAEIVGDFIMSWHTKEQ